MIDVSIVMPCLNERQTLGHCIAVAQRALDVLTARHSLVGEIIVADNGSTDGSQEVARSLGARVVDVSRPGYGAAVCGGFAAAGGRYRVSDAHCGLRALTRRCFVKLRLEGAGMELASEMVIKAALLNQRIVEVPVTLWPDRRGRPPHLQPWRDGWRHLRYLLMLSPHWLFALPALLLGTVSLAILMTIAVAWLSNAETTRFGNYWAILAGSTLTLSHVGVVLALAGQLYGIRERYRTASRFLKFLAPWLRLESMLIAGLCAIAMGLAILVAIFVYWSAHSLEAIANVLPAVIGTCAVAIGTQNILGGFLLAIVSGNEAEFLRAVHPINEESAGPRASAPAGLQVSDSAAVSANRRI